MKKIIFLTLLLILFADTTLAFNDLHSVPHYSESIERLRDSGVLKTRNSFHPQRNLSRIEFVQLMYEAGLFPEKCNYPALRFSDTLLNQWYTPALRAGVLCGGLKGDGDNAFRPSDPINYAEVATAIHRSIKGTTVSSGAWFEPGLAFFKESDISLPENPKPEENINRAQGAYIIDQILAQDDSYFSAEKLVSSARTQKGVVTSYDTGYYSGGYPPDDTGACTDVVERALRELGYDWKGMLDSHMRRNPHLYPANYDSNINFRRVRNVKIFLDHTATKVPLDSKYLPGDIVTYDQIPGSLWHIAIVSDRKASDGTPLLIHNYGRGVVEDNLLHSWPAPKTGHYRLKL